MGTEHIFDKKQWHHGWPCGSVHLLFRSFLWNGGILEVEIRFSATKTLVKKRSLLQHVFNNKTRDSLHHPAIPQHGPQDRPIQHPSIEEVWLDGGMSPSTHRIVTCDSIDGRNESKGNLLYKFHQLAKYLRKYFSWISCRLTGWHSWLMMYDLSRLLKMASI